MTAEGVVTVVGRETILSVGTGEPGDQLQQGLQHHTERRRSEPVPWIHQGK